MFDPTVFDNLKVALENQLYDIDNLEQRIRITGRVDRMEMAVLGREFALRFRLADDSRVTAEIVLEASLQDLAAEILETEGAEPGCSLILRYHLQVKDVARQCRKIEEIVRNIWQPARPPVQTLSFRYGEEGGVCHNTVELRFDRKINEEQMNDLPDLTEHMIHTLLELREV